MNCTGWCGDKPSQGCQSSKDESILLVGTEITERAGAGWSYCLWEGARLVILNIGLE